MPNRPGSSRTTLWSTPSAVTAGARGRQLWKTGRRRRKGPPRPNRAPPTHPRLSHASREASPESQPSSPESHPSLESHQSLESHPGEPPTNVPLISRTSPTPTWTPPPTPNDRPPPTPKTPPTPTASSRTAAGLPARIPGQTGGESPWAAFAQSWEEVAAPIAPPLAPPTGPAAQPTAAGLTFATDRAATDRAATDRAATRRDAGRGTARPERRRRARRCRRTDTAVWSADDDLGPAGASDREGARRPDCDRGGSGGRDRGRPERGQITDLPILRG